MAKIPRVSKILETASKTKGRKNKIEFLRSHRPNQTMLTIFRHAFDPVLRFHLPEGEPPYTPGDPDLTENGLYQNARKLKLFTKDGKPGLSDLRREVLFVEFLETIHPEDAKLILGVKDGKLPYKTLTEALIREAYPALLPPTDK